MICFSLPALGASGYLPGAGALKPASCMSPANVLHWPHPDTGASNVTNSVRTRGAPQTAGLVLAALIALGAALRLYGLGAWGLWYDEANTLYAAALTSTPAALLDTDAVTDAPLFSALVWLWRHVLQWTTLAPGTEGYDIALRLLPWLFSVLAIPLTFVVARQLLCDDRPALFAAALVALSPFQVCYAQELRNYSLHLVLMLGALGFAVRAMQRNRVMDWAGLAACLALGVWNHFYVLWYMMFFSLAFLLVLPWHGTRRLAGWTAANAAAVALAAPAIAMAFRVDAIVAGITTQWYPELTWKAGFITFKAFFAGYSPRAYLYWPLFVLAIGLCAAGMFRLRKQPQTLVWLAVLTFGPVVGSVVLWSLRDFSFYQHRLFIFSGATASILVAQGLACLRWRPVLAGTVVTWVALTLPTLADHYAQRLHPLEQHRLGVRYRVENRAAATHIRDAAAATDEVFHCSHVTLPSFRYYTGPHVENLHAGFTDVDFQGFLSAYPHPTMWTRMGMMPVRLDAALRQGAPLWYVESWWEPYDRPPHCNLYRAYLDHHFVQTERSAFFGVTVYRYDTHPERALAVRRSCLADYGDWQALSYRFPDGATVEPAQAWSPAARAHAPENFGLRFTEGTSPDAPVLSVAQGAVAGSAVVVNPGLVGDVNLEGFLSVARVDAPAFWRETPGSDAWFFAQQYDPARNGPRDLPAFVAKLARDSVPASLYADVLLPDGDFDVYAWVLHVEERFNTSRGTLLVSMEALDTAWKADALVPSSPAMPTGWAWRRLGSARFAGGPWRLRVTASNPDQLAEAYVDFGGVAFVSTEVSKGADPLSPAWSQNLRVEAGETAAVQWEAAWPSSLPPRFDLVGESPAENAFRHIFVSMPGE
jgi:hypothetical protein